MQRIGVEPVARTKRSAVPAGVWQLPELQTSHWYLVMRKSHATILADFDKFANEHPDVPVSDSQTPMKRPICRNLPGFKS